MGSSSRRKLGESFGNQRETRVRECRIRNLCSSSPSLLQFSPAEQSRLDPKNLPPAAQRRRQNATASVQEPCGCRPLLWKQRGLHVHLATVPDCLRLHWLRARHCLCTRPPVLLALPPAPWYTCERPSYDEQNQINAESQPHRKRAAEKK